MFNYIKIFFSTILKKLFSKNESSKQFQFMTSNSQGIQAGRDVITNYGLRANEVIKILDNFSLQQTCLIDKGKENVEKRLKEFKKEILNLISNHNINIQLFEQPDFLYILSQAQHNYTRIEDEEVKKIFLKMIEERSKCVNQDIRSLIFNEAIKTIPFLTNITRSS